MKKPLATDREETRNLEGVSVHGGFPNPAAESPLENPDFNKLLVRHPTATYCLRISGNAWEDRGVFNDDIAVIDRAVAANAQDLVIWWEEDSFIIDKRQCLPKRLSYWGVVVAIIHQYRTGVER